MHCSFRSSASDIPDLKQLSNDSKSCLSGAPRCHSYPSLAARPQIDVHTDEPRPNRKDFPPDRRRQFNRVKKDCRNNTRAAICQAYKQDRPLQPIDLCDRQREEGYRALADLDWCEC